jgi:ABC-type lipoprotein release transport system permease subunit
VCGSSACTDLHGGRLAITVPTVTGTGTLNCSEIAKVPALKGCPFNFGVLVFTAAIAGIIPARRAASIDPARALRIE